LSPSPGSSCFLPAILGAIILLVVGWILSSLVARVVGTLLRRIGFETMAQRTGVTGFITMTGARDASASRIIAELVKWLIRLIFIEMAAEALHISAVTTLINSIVLFIPSLIVALVVVMVGFLIASFVGNVVRGGAAEMGFRNPNLLAGAARMTIIGLAVLMALSQIGIAATLVNSLFIAFVAAIALALGSGLRPGRSGGGRPDVGAVVCDAVGAPPRGWRRRPPRMSARKPKRSLRSRRPDYEPLPPATPYQPHHEQRAG